MGGYPERNWEGDMDMVGVLQNCTTDISKQLVDDNFGINMSVIHDWDKKDFYD